MSGWTKREIVALLRDPDPAPLFGAATETCAAYFGGTVHLRALLETGNVCRADCLYCGLRRSNRSIERYRLGAEVVVVTAARAAAGGFRTVVMQSGEDPLQQPELLRDIVASIRERIDAAITLSYGEWPRDVFDMWRQAGADRYLLKFETADSKLFRRLRPGRTLDQRLACVQSLKDTGYQVGTGFMVGLPGQTLDDIADNLLMLHEINPDMAGIGPYIPHPGTPLGAKCMNGKEAPVWGAEPASGDCDFGMMTLRCLAVARIMNPALYLPATTALETLIKDGNLQGLNAGANVIMVDVTPAAYRHLYELYPGKPLCSDEEPAVLYSRCRDMLRSAGFAVANEKGDGVKYSDQGSGLLPEEKAMGALPQNSPCHSSPARG